MLFANKEAKSFNPNDAIAKGFDNTDVKGDERKFKAVMEKNLQAMAFSFKNIFGKNIVIWLRART